MDIEVISKDVGQYEHNGSSNVPERAEQRKKVSREMEKHRDKIISEWFSYRNTVRDNRGTRCMEKQSRESKLDWCFVHYNIEEKLGDAKP